MTSVVTELVTETVAASGAALCAHLETLLLKATGHENQADIAEALDFGYDADLDDKVALDQAIGFDHGLVSDSFRHHLKESQKRSLAADGRVSPYVWGADEDREIYSLFGRTSSPKKKPKRPPKLRATRASQLVKRLMKQAREMRDAEKATTSREQSVREVLVPSPLQIAAELLTDPSNISSSEYALSAIRELLLEKYRAKNPELRLTNAALSAALETINGRMSTNKPIEDRGLTIRFVCHWLAAKGAMALRFNFEPDAIKLLGSDVWSALIDHATFVSNPALKELPNVSSLLNELNGLPIPIEGASTILDGGLRFSDDGLAVVAVSGTFGVGKTSLALSLAASLAPLGCRTLYLSCEEEVSDISTRLLEATPDYLHRFPPLFAAAEQISFRLPESAERADSSEGKVELSWFDAASLRAISLPEDVDDLESYELEAGEDAEPIGPAGQVEEQLGLVLRKALKRATIFEPFIKRRSDASTNLPSLARPIIIVDGLHQLFGGESEENVTRAFRALLDQCKHERALLIFTYADEDKSLRRLDYLCDLVFDLGRVGFDSPEQRPTRLIRLLKSRRQPSRPGAHVFHLQGSKRFRIKPSVGARADAAKMWEWTDPTPDQLVLLTNERMTRAALSSSLANDTPPPHVRDRSQILVKGRGSSGKAGFGLYLLHRRPTDVSVQPEIQRELFDLGKESEKGVRTVESVFKKSNLPIRLAPQFLETRVLVVSFLYPQKYYSRLTTKLKQKRPSSPPRKNYGRWDEFGAVELNSFPDELYTETVDLYPGMLRVEEFLAKIDNRLRAAELRGMPFTGVLVDGLHNVFVQFPALENSPGFWPDLYALLRRRSVSVVTTHTEFEIPGPYGELAIDVHSAQKKMAPLLSALVSAADYLFDLSADPIVPDLPGQTQDSARLSQLTALGADPFGLAFLWDRKNLVLERIPGAGRGIDLGEAALLPRRTSKRAD